MKKIDFKMVKQELLEQRWMFSISRCFITFKSR